MVSAQTSPTPGTIVKDGDPDSNAELPTLEQQITGFFTLTGFVGKIQPVGTVLRNSRIDVTVAASRLDEEGNPPPPCPVKVTIYVQNRNNNASFQRVVRRANGNARTVSLLNTRFIGEAVVIIQQQNVNHLCLGLTEINVSLN